jgi:hypothetical protein
VRRLGAIRLWCPETIQEVLGIDDRHVAVRGHSSLFAWDHRDGFLRFHAPASVGRRVVLSPDAKWLALIDEDVRIVSAAPRATWATPPTLATWPAFDLVFSSDDRAVVIGPEGIEIRRVPTGEVLTRATSDARPRFVACDRMLAELSVDQRTIRFRDPHTLGVTHERGFDDTIDAFDISPDGTRVVITDGPSLLLG